ncbi:MAG: hypothetical protein U0183_10730 [Polyangiaceae bacterium]
MTDTSARLVQARRDFLEEQERACTNAAPAGSLTKESATGRSSEPSPRAPTRQNADVDTAAALAKARRDFLEEQERACTNAAPAGSLTKESVTGRHSADDIEARARALELY